MMFIGKGNLKGAVRSLQRNKGRSFLTMLGVIIGVTSVVLAVGIGEGIKHQIGLQTEHLGRDLITIRPGQVLMQQPFSGIGTAGGLSDKDISVVQKTAGVAQAAPLSLVGGGVTAGDTNRSANALVIGTSSALPAILNQTLSYGIFFGDEPFSADKVVVGSHIAQTLFDLNVPLGQPVMILGHQFVVIGIFNEFETAPLSVDADFNNAVFIPYTSALQITNSDSPLYEILARPTVPAQTSTVVNRLSANLLSSHGGQHDFSVLEQSRTLAATNKILNLLTALIGGVAAISLFVGGIGIMNVMLVSVTERMHEVGIRKAIGATSRQILSQFMTEAAVLSTTGGLLGIALSFLLEVVLRLFTTLTPLITWQIVAIAFVVSVGIGIIFGSVPALKAAHKEAIDALRND